MRSVQLRFSLLPARGWFPSSLWRRSPVCDLLWGRIESKHHLMLRAVMRTQPGISPLSAHLLNLPRRGRRVRVYLSLPRWSTWPSSASRTHTHAYTLRGEPIHSHPHRVGSESLQRQNLACSPTLSALCASCSARPSSVSALLSVGPVVLWGFRDGGGGSAVSLLVLPVSSLIVHRLHPLAN